MPLFDLYCPACDCVDEDVFLKNYANIKECPKCSGPREKLVVTARMSVIGPTPTKPLEVAGVGRFESQSEVRRYEQANPEVRFRTKQDGKAMAESARARSDKNAQKHGYRDYAHFRAENSKKQQSG